MFEIVEGRKNLFFFIVEPGFLEDQAKLLVSSFNRFTESSDELLAINPRGTGISSELATFLKQQGVNLINIKLNRDWIFYPLANKVVCSAYVEDHYNHLYENLIFLDTDILVVRDFHSLFDGDFHLAAKSDDDLNDIRWPVNSKPNKFWSLIANGCQINDNDLWSMTNSVNPQPFNVFFNSGVIVKKDTSPFFSYWLENFKRILSDRRLFHIDYLNFFFLEQASFSLTVAKQYSKERIKELGYEFNYPVHLHAELNLEQPILLHYHDEFYKDRWQQSYPSMFGINDSLQQFLPLEKRSRPIQDKIVRILAFQWHKLKFKYLGLK